MTVESALQAVLAVLAVVAVIVPLTIRSRNQAAVRSSSVALRRLERLNNNFRRRLPSSQPMTHDWVDVVDSKSKLERYDLHVMFLTHLMAHENEIDQYVARLLSATSIFKDYERRYEQLRRVHLGQSSAPGLSADKYRPIEERLFADGKLPAPASELRVRCTVRYTSPKGQNAYAKQREWDFNGLQQGLAEMRQIRQQQSTASFLRQQERNRMTGSLRYQVLQRDRSRCRGCGASAVNQGVTLHVDHIVPVSKGGKTELSNLQTLCQACNLGKSNRF